MSRSLQRQIQRSQKRQIAAVQKAATLLYGATVTLADAHPDIQELFAVTYALSEAHKFGDGVAVSNGFGVLNSLLERYAGQVEKEALTESAA